MKGHQLQLPTRETTKEKSTFSLGKIFLPPSPKTTSYSSALRHRISHSKSLYSRNQEKVRSYLKSLHAPVSHKEQNLDTEQGNAMSTEVSCTASGANDEHMIMPASATRPFARMCRYPYEIQVTYMTCIRTQVKLNMHRQVRPKHTHMKVQQRCPRTLMCAVPRSSKSCTSVSRLSNRWCTAKNTYE